MSDTVNLREKLASFDETWVPKVVGELNGQLVKVAKFLGSYVFHHHENEDEMFLVVKGCMRMVLRDREFTLREGEFCIVPRGVEHKPVADELCEVVLFEPATTLNTGNTRNDFTLEDLERI